MKSTFLRRVGIGRRGRVLLAGGALLALGAAGAAMAGTGPFPFSGMFRGPGSASLVSATFYADTVSGSTRTQTCTAANKDSITVTDETLTGTATSSSDSSLNGSLTIQVQSVWDSTSKAGTVNARFRVSGSSSSSPGQFQGTLAGVDDNGVVQGTLSGQESSGDQFLGNVTSSFSTSSGFGSSSTPGTIGSGSATDSAVETGGSSCGPQPPTTTGTTTGTTTTGTTTNPWLPPRPGPIGPFPFQRGGQSFGSRHNRHH